MAREARGKKAKRPSYKKVVLSRPGQRDIKLVALGRLLSALGVGTALVSVAHIVDSYWAGETIEQAGGMPKNAVLGRGLLDGTLKEPGDRTDEEMFNLETKPKGFRIK